MIRFRVPPDDHARAARGQRQYIERLAKAIESGEPLDLMAREWAAGVLRAFARQIPEREKRGRGERARKIDPGNTAIEFVLLKREGHSDNQAHAILAERHDVSEQAIKKVLTGPQGQLEEAFKLFGLNHKKKLVARSIRGTRK